MRRRRGASSAPEKGRHGVESRTLRILQSGRDLLRPPSDRPGIGLLALGDVDFAGEPVRLAMADAAAAVIPGSDPLAGGTERRCSPRPRPSATASTRRRRAGARSTRSPRSTAPRARPSRSKIWREGKASESRLATHAPPPRALHLATHGFYRDAEGARDRPMLLSGIALAGANLALEAEGEDGVLYALAARNLNLEGTELVVLSACETAQGVIGHGEAVYGLARALRTAGARNVLVTLRSIGDDSAATFMLTFYSKWLSQPPGQSSPAQALDETRRHFIATDPDFDWTPLSSSGKGDHPPADQQR